MKEYITINEQSYRVSHSFATLAKFSEMTGRSSLEQMSELGTMSPNDLLTMFYCAIYIGEKIDGKQLQLKSPEELGMMVGIPTIQEYVKIFAKQMRAELPVSENGDAEVKKKKHRFLSLRG